MKQLIKAPIVAMALLLAFSIVPHYVVYAEDSETELSEQEKKAAEAAKKLEEQRREAAKKRSEELKKQREEDNEATKQLAERFKKACENRREGYKNRLENIAERAKKHAEVINKIVERVKEFKETKNLTVENYDALLAEIDVKKQVVESIQEAAKEAAEVEFSCERDAAKESVAAFRDILHQQIDALKEYKTAVKNLIVAIKTSIEGSSAEEGGSDESQE